MQQRKVSADVCLAASVLLVAWGLLAPTPVFGQEFRFEGGGTQARLLAREGAAQILEVQGPALAGPREYFYRPSPPFDVRNRWILVQDSTFGVVFAQESGVRGDIGSYAGDLYLRALADVRAVEVRALVFNVWGDYADHLSVTVLVDRAVGESWEIHPLWPAESPAHEHRTSIVWIHRVMLADQSVIEADPSPLARAWEFVTSTDFEGLLDDPPVRAMGQ
ncbi:MAG: hypothetical protein ABL963_14510 [Longimicrobiales bacterium]